MIKLLRSDRYGRIRDYGIGVTFTWVAGSEGFFDAEEPDAVDDVEEGDWHRHDGESVWE